MVNDWLKSSRILWILAIWAVLPFFLRLNLDYQAVERQGVLSLYREWRMSPGVRDLKPGTDIVFEASNSKNRLEEAFRTQLARDFRIVEQGDAPRVQAVFTVSGRLHGRIEMKEVWRGSVRLINNGILLGLWVALLVVFLGLPFSWALVFGAGIVLFWRSHWNLLGVPQDTFLALYRIGEEIAVRATTGNWNATELGRAAELFGLLCLPLSVAAYFWDRWRLWRRHRLAGHLLVGLALEPVFLWTVSLFAQWGAETSWLRIYVGSFGFRFLFLGLLLYALLDRGWVTRLQDQWAQRSASLVPILTSAVMLVSGLWAWGQSALYPEPSDTVVRLKVFIVSLLLALVTGSRMFSLGLGLLLVAVILPPSRGHLQAASLVGLSLDALFVGWVLSPFKSFGPGALIGTPLRHFAFIGIAGWLFGVLLSSVGIPLVACWGLFLFAVWAYAQLSASPSEASHEPLR